MGGLPRVGWHGKRANDGQVRRRARDLVGGNASVVVDEVRSGEASVEAGGSDGDLG